MEKLRKNFPYGKKDLVKVAKGARISIVYDDSIDTGTFHSVDDENVVLSYAQGTVTKSFPLHNLRSFALI